MTLGGTDLNLLVALEALLEEGSVTRAGRRLGMSQPAMSGALAKLRRRFADDLLVPVGRGYEPTSLAREILPELRAAVSLMQRALRTHTEFDPTTEERTFRVAMSDYAAAVFLGPLLALVAQEAPRIRLALEPIDTHAWAARHALADIDALVAPDDLVLPGQRRFLWSDRVVLLARRDHPHVRDGSISAADLDRTSVAAASFGDGAEPQIKASLRDRGVQPHIVLETTGFLGLPFVVRASHVVAAIPERLARVHCRQDPDLVMVPLPVEDEIHIRDACWFSDTRASSPAHRWLFDAFERTARTLA